MGTMSGGRPRDHQLAGVNSDSRERLWWRAYFLVIALGAIAFVLFFPRLDPLLAGLPALLIPVVRLAILLAADPRPLRELIATSWARAWTLAIIAILPLAVVLWGIGLPLEAAVLPALLISVTRLAILVGRDGSRPLLRS